MIIAATCVGVAHSGAACMPRPQRVVDVIVVSTDFVAWGTDSTVYTWVFLYDHCVLDGFSQEIIMIAGFIMSNFIWFFQAKLLLLL